MSGENEREKRAYDEPEQIKKEQGGIGVDTANRIVKETFKYGDFTYIYYKYIDKFHLEPKGFVDLFEYLNYNETISKIEGALDSIRKLQDGK